MSVTVILYQHFRASSSMLTWGGGNLPRICFYLCIIHQKTVPNWVAGEESKSARRIHCQHINPRPDGGGGGAKRPLQFSYHSSKTK